MGKSLTSALFYCVLFGLLVSCYAQTQTCESYTFSNGRQYATCSDLPVLSSFLHWNYSSSNNTVDLAFRHTGTSSSRWTAWALNPSGARMAGAQSLVAFQSSSAGIRAYTSALPSTGSPTSLPETDLSFNVSNLNATLTGDEMIIFATLHLADNLVSTNQVWQEGPMSGDNPGQHPLNGDNGISVGTIDFRTGQTQSETGGITSRQTRRNTHGVLNAVSWGVLMPMGAMMARYLKVFKFANPAWFYLHIACQSSGYIVGVAGWATGIKLGNDNKSIKYTTHRNIGITLFALATLQMFALLLRPKPDHKYRIFWNIYHHTIGYTIIVLSIYNVFEGFDILDPEEKWKWIYIGILIFLGSVAILLEAITWYIVLMRKNENSDKNQNPYSTNEVNGVNGHGARTQQAV